MYTLGINAAYHDCSACLVHDGRVIAAAEEERFTRIRHGKRPLPFTAWQLPFHAIDYCLREARIDLCDVQHVAYAFAPSLMLGACAKAAVIELPLEPSAHASEWLSPWDPLFLSYVVNAPRRLADGAPHHLKARFRGMRHDGPYRWHFVEHLLAHEASAFLASPYERTAVLVLNGRGEFAATAYGMLEDGKYRRIKQVGLPHSLGLFYEEISAYLGFQPSSDEGGMTALAESGTPRYAPLLREIMRYRDDGDVEIKRADWKRLFGPPRETGAALSEHHRDIASSLQAVLEDTVLRMAGWLQRETGAENCCMAGELTLNCALNAAVRARGPFRKVWVQPAAGDAGTALGAALWTDRQQGGDRERIWKMEHAFLGPAFDDADIEALLKQAKLPYRRVDDIAQAGAALLAQNKVLAWFQGRMEFGQNALGARSILASPLAAAMRSEVNRIRGRDAFHPVASVVPEEAAADWFIDAGSTSFMSFACRLAPNNAERIPALCAMPGTAQVQTIARAQNPLFHELVSAFGERTGVPVLINAPFDTRDEPMACTPRDAVAMYSTTALDALAIGSFLLEKPS